MLKPTAAWMMGRTLNRKAFSSLDLLIALAIIIFIFILVPEHHSRKKYHDMADDYIDRGNKKTVKDLYGAKK